MTVDDLKTLYGAENDSQLSKKFNLTKGTISKWRKKGIPAEWQLGIELLTGGKVKADNTKTPNIPRLPT